MDLSHMLTKTEAARLLDVSDTHAGWLADKGYLTVIKTPLGRLFDRLSVERLARERRQAAHVAAARGGDHN